MKKKKRQRSLFKDHISPINWKALLHVPSSEPTNAFRSSCTAVSSHGRRGRLRSLRKYTSQVQVQTRFTSLPPTAQVIDAVNNCLKNRLSICLQIMQRAPGLQLPAVVGFSVSKLSLNCSRSYCLCSCKSPQETHGFVQNHCVVLVCGLFELVRRCVCVCTVTSLEKVSYSRPVPLCHSLLFLYWGRMTSLKMYVIFKLLL